MELKFEYMQIDDLKPYERNARKHEKKDVAAIAASIERFGFDDPVGIWGPENIIVEGHGRILAAKQLGMTSVPCIRLDHLSEEERRAYALAHNRTAELSVWEENIKALELAAITTIDMTAFGFDGPEQEVVEDDYEPHPPEKPTSARGEVWQLGRHRLMCGDATSVSDVQQLMDGAKADMLLTDPPYNVDVHETAGTIINDKQDEQSFIDFLTASLKAAHGVLRGGGAFHVWHAATTAYSFFAALKAANMQLRQVLVWVKNQSTLSRSDFQWQHEPCAAGELEEWESEDTDNVAYGWTDGRHAWYKKRKEKTVLFFDKPLHSKEHPTMKPVLLFDYEMQCNTAPGEIVLDLFGGSGTTIIAAEQNGRTAYVMELDPKYVDVIIDRWESFTGEKAIKVS